MASRNPLLPVGRVDLRCSCKERPAAHPGVRLRQRLSDGRAGLQQRRPDRSTGNPKMAETPRVPVGPIYLQLRCQGRPPASARLGPPEGRRPPWRVQYVQRGGLRGPPGRPRVAEEQKPPRAQHQRVPKRGRSRSPRRAQVAPRQRMSVGRTGLRGRSRPRRPADAAVGEV
eukprot:scaffold268328_cov36-Prasinocladus_malaysianus.AAC.1